MARNEVPEGIGPRLRRRFIFVMHLLVTLPTFFWLLQMSFAGTAARPNPQYWPPASFFMAGIVILLLVHLIRFTYVELMLRGLHRDNELNLTSEANILKHTKPKSDVSMQLDDAGELV